MLAVKVAVAVVTQHHVLAAGHVNDFSTSSFDDSGSNYSLPHINLVQNETQKNPVDYDLSSFNCYVCKTNHSISFQDMPCGYYAINNVL
jgi:hypothetical protein